MNSESQSPQAVPPVGAGTDPGTTVSPDLVHVSQSLHRQYDERLGRELVDSEIRHVAEEFTDVPVRAFVPLLVRRYTGEALQADCLDADQNGHATDGE
jgi:hypothetical protein